MLLQHFCAPCGFVVALTVGLCARAFADGDGHLPALPPLALRSATLLRAIPVYGATGAVFLPSNQVAVASESLEIWDCKSGRRLKNVTVQEFPNLEDLRVSPRGDFLAALCYSDPDHDLGGSAVALWDLKKRKWARIQRAPQTRDGDFASLAVSPDGQRLATTQLSTATHDFRDEAQKRGQLRLWNARTGRLLQTLRRGRFYNLQFSPDGKSLLASTEHDAFLLNLRTGRQKRLKNAGAWALCFSPDGKKVASIQRSSAQFGGEIRVFATASGRLIYRVPVRWSDVSDLCFSPDGKDLLVAGGSSENHDSSGKELDPARGEVLFLRASDGKIESRLAVSDKGEISSLALARDGKTLATVEYGDKQNGGVKIWHLK